MTTQTRTIRTIAGIINSRQTLEGEGMLVRRPFPKSSFSDFDPFLLLDELGPIDVEPGEAKGAPDHPHRGFETVSYILEGSLEHKDSQGHAGKLNSGDVQWMTAGSGVVHSEMLEKEFANLGGRLHGLQLWVNLPRHEIMYLHFTLQRGASAVQPVPKEYNAFIYVLDGEGLFGAGEERAEDGQMVIFAQDGEEVVIKNSADVESPLNVLLIAGVPLNEPVVRYGSFVMNTETEIVQAIDDYRNGRMGSIDF